MIGAATRWRKRVTGIVITSLVSMSLEPAKGGTNHRAAVLMYCSD